MIRVNNAQTPLKAKKYLNECVDTNWFSGEGPFVSKFEEKFANYLDCKYAVAVNSGTASLHLALVTLGIGSGDEVILPASTIASCYFAIWYTGAKAVAVDVDPQTYNIDPKLIEQKITARTKAIMVVHLYGHPCDMDPIVTIAKKHHLYIVEDAAEAHGATYKGKKVGSIGDIGCFSFYANKIVSCGEGGMLVTNNKRLFDKASTLSKLNFDPKKRFIHQGLGFRYDMTNMQAAVGLASLEEINKSIKFKKKMANFYNKTLKNIDGLILPVEKLWANNVYWMYAVRINAALFGMSRDKLIRILENKYQIQTRSFFYSPNIAFKAMNLYQKEKFPVAETIGEEGMYLPSGIGNSLAEFKKVTEAIIEISKKNKN